MTTRSYSRATVSSAFSIGSPSPIVATASCSRARCSCGSGRSGPTGDPRPGSPAPRRWSVGRDPGRSPCHRCHAGSAGRSRLRRRWHPAGSHSGRGRTRRHARRTPGPLRKSAPHAADRHGAGRRGLAGAGNVRVPHAARLPPARAARLPAGGSDRGEVRGDGRARRPQQPHQGLLRPPPSRELLPLPPMSG